MNRTGCYLPLLAINGSGEIPKRGRKEDIRQFTMRHTTMTDVFSKAKRSWVMSRIRCKNTNPELVVRSFLHGRGFRFRLHARDLPGKPDLVLPKYRTVIFVHGCFWHHHSRCRNATFPSTRSMFWRSKILSNKRRDAKAVRELRSLGWDVLTVWECETEAGGSPSRALTPLLRKQKIVLPFV
jgi:DNA mismatch endonuclease (patch repair protein)